MAAKQASTQLPETGFVRLPQILAVYPVSRATWWNMVKDGRAPKPIKLSERCTAWRAADIRNLISETEARA